MSSSGSGRWRATVRDLEQADVLAVFGEINACVLVSLVQSEVWWVRRNPVAEIPHLHCWIMIYKEKIDETNRSSAPVCAITMIGMSRWDDEVVTIRSQVITITRWSSLEVQTYFNTVFKRSIYTADAAYAWGKIHQSIEIVYGQAGCLVIKASVQSFYLIFPE